MTTTLVADEAGPGYPAHILHPRDLEHALVVIRQLYGGGYRRFAFSGDKLAGGPR
jgi:hypothetical protein